MENTTGTEDQIIFNAQQQSHIELLVDIISRLDDEINEWKKVSGCDDPDELLEWMKENGQ